MSILYQTQFYELSSKSSSVIPSIRLPLAPNPNVPVRIDMDVDDIWTATNRTVFDIFLIGTRCHIYRNNNFLAAGVTNVGGIILHVLILHSINEA